MKTRITIKGQVTIPRHVRDALLLSAGDAVEFQLNGNGEVVFRKAPAIELEDPRATPPEHPRVDAQMQRRAEELLTLLRGLD